jgi:hypothetical protein
MPCEPCAKTVEFVKNQIFSNEFINTYKRSKSDFTRKRTLPFQTVLIFLMNMLRSSLQNELDIFFKLINKKETLNREVTASAFSQARQKLKHEAFIELNEKTLNHFYDDNDIKKWNGFRLLAVDGSTIKVPKTDDVREYFGELAPRQGENCPMARISQCFDVLNHLSIDAIIESRSVGERNLAARHFNLIGSGDLILLDRGYPAFWLFRLIYEKGADFCARLPLNQWNITNKFLATGLQEQIVNLTMNASSKAKCIELGLSTESIKLRLIRINNENKDVPTVLITSLIDTDLYPMDIFRELYHQRWPIEEDYKIIKSRIEIENFTGKNVESVKQDFHANIFTCNLTSILAFPVHDKIEQKYEHNKLDYKINWTQAFAKMRNFGVLIYFRTNLAEFIENLHILFMENVSAIRPGRNFPRKNKVQKKRHDFSYKPIS